MKIANQKSKIKNAFTLIEIMVSLVVVVMAMSIITVTFSTVTKAWRRGTQLAESLNHGDFVMDQLVSGLRSAYYPDSTKNAAYGFWLEDTGSGEHARDEISWVKRGTALTSSNSPTVAGPHRVSFTVEDDEDGDPAAAVRYWRPYALPEDFNSDTDTEPVFLSSRVVGFDCRVSTNISDSAWTWQDLWEEENTNTLPYAVELTLYLEGLEEGDPAVEIKRAVEIPVAHLSRQ